MNEIFQAATLRDVAVLFDSLHKTPPYSDTGLPMIRVTDIKRGFVNTKNALKVTQEIYEEFTRKHKPQAGDIIFSRVGSYGNSSFVKNSEQFCLGQNTVCISPKKDVIDPFFLYCFLNSQGATKQIEGFVTGASQPTISLKSINAIEVPLVALDTQRRIASILSAYDDLIENNTRRIAILEEMARRIYEEWFVHFRFPGHEQVKMVESELGLIPEGWEATTLDAVSEYINRGLTPKYDEQVEGLVINQKCIRGQKLNYEFARRQSKSIPADKRVRYGDVLINSTGVGTLGRVAQVLDERPNCTVDTHVTIARPGKKVKVHFYGLALYAREQHFEQQGVGATGQTELGRGRVAETSSILPPVVLQEQFDEIVAPMRRMAVILGTKNTNLRTTRDLLLPKLISGELDVSTLPEFTRLTAPEEAIAA